MPVYFKLIGFWRILKHTVSKKFDKYGPRFHIQHFSTHLCFPPDYVGAIFKFNRL